jgi:hypothetical protein
MVGQLRFDARGQTDYVAKTQTFQIELDVSKD